MRKLLLTALMLNLTNVLAFADVDPLAPQWKDFFNPDSAQKVSWREVGLIRMNSANKTEDAYWQNRKLVFDDEVKGCSAMPDAAVKMNCYMQVRQIENQKNTEHISTRDSRRMRRIISGLSAPQPVYHYTAPTYNPYAGLSTSTHCSSYGNQTNCTSY